MNYSDEHLSKPFTIIIKIILVVATLFIGFFLARMVIIPFKISDDSMKPLLKAGDTVLILKHTKLKKGDIVLFDSPIEPGRVLLKRIIAGDMDTVEIRNKVVYINDLKFTFPWKVIHSDPRIFPLTFSNRDNLPAIRLKHGWYFLIGDNIDNSFDSRNFGIINKDKIIGKMVKKFSSKK